MSHVDPPNPTLARVRAAIGTTTSALTADDHARLITAEITRVRQATTQHAQHTTAPGGSPLDETLRRRVQEVTA